MVLLPSRPPETPPIDKYYADLLNGSMFSKADAPPPPREFGSGSNGGGGTFGGPSTPSGPPPMGPSVESGLALRGIVIEDQETFAFIEDANSRQIYRVRVGDNVARGKLSSATLAEVVYESNGRKVHVNIGCNLDGILAPTATSMLSSGMPSYTPTPSSGAPGTPTTTPSGTTGGGAPLSALEEMMRKRRAEQGGAR